MAASATSTLSSTLRAFRLSNSLGAFVQGPVHISGWARWLFPPSPVMLTIRTLLLPGDRVRCTLSFGGRLFLRTTYSRSNLNTSHVVASLLALDFHLDWQEALAWHEAMTATTTTTTTTNQNNKLQQTATAATSITTITAATTVEPCSLRISPRHVCTVLCKLLPVSRRWASLHLELELDLQQPGGSSSSWEQSVQVRTCAERVLLLGYQGSLRLLDSNIRYVSGFHHLLFDGHCNLCNASVDFIMRNDPERRFVFCAQQDSAATKLLAQRGLSLPSARGEEDSVLLLAPDGELYERSAAALRCGAALRWPWSWLSKLCLLLPSCLLDVGYNWIGRHRYAWFGKTDTCRLPTPDERTRFL
eukprot:g10091.t1